MTEITRENFLAAMRKAVEMRGEDYVYPSLEGDPSLRGDAGECLYSKDGQPQCIIGMALYLIDPALMPTNVEDDELALNWDGDRHLYCLDMDAATVLRRRGVEDRGLLDAAEHAQSLQDNGRRWGEALEEFENALRAAPLGRSW